MKIDEEAMEKRISIFTIQLLAVLFFSAPNLFSQNSDILFVKLKEQQNQKLFYQTVFRNPSLMTDFGKQKFSTVTLHYKNSQNDAYRIQLPEGEEAFEVEARSFLPLANHQSLWGKATYNNQTLKNIRWNESLDYELVYPYFTADEVGGNLSQENYSFLGGFAKKNQQWNFGISLDYQAALASRSKDPRPKNISSDLNLNTGFLFKNILGFDAGFYGGFQKYTQSNDIKFFSQLGSPPVYHLNGMGYYNNLLKGTKLRAFYEGYGYRLGTEITNSNTRNIWLTVRYDRLDIEKITLEGNGVKAMQLTNKELNINLIKLFYSEQNTYGIKLNYRNDTKIGLEPILSGRDSNNSIFEISQNENYNLKNTTYELSGLFYSEKKRQVSFLPFVNYQTYREDYSLIKSFQHFDYLNVGANFMYINMFDSKNILSFALTISHRKNLSKSSLLRNDEEISLSKMMLHNYRFLASDFTKCGINFKIDHRLSSKFNVFWGINSEIAIFERKMNYLYNISTGISF